MEAVEEPSLWREPQTISGGLERERWGALAFPPPLPQIGGGFLLSKSSERQSPPPLPHPIPLGKAQVALVSPTLSTLSSGPQSPASVRQGLVSEMRSARSRALPAVRHWGGLAEASWCEGSAPSPQGELQPPDRGCPSYHLLTDSPGPWSCSVCIHSSGSLPTLTKYLLSGKWLQDRGQRGSFPRLALSSQPRGGDRIGQLESGVMVVVVGGWWKARRGRN